MDVSLSGTIDQRTYLKTNYGVSAPLAPPGSAYAYTFRILGNLRLPWNFSLYWIYFLHSGFWTTCACPERHGVPWIHCIENIFFIIPDFWATFSCPEKQCALNSLYWIHFTIQDFWATCAFPENQSCSEIFHCIEIFFIIQDYWATRACPENFKPWGCLSPRLVRLW